MEHDLPSTQRYMDKSGIDTFELKSALYLIIANYYSQFTVSRKHHSQSTWTLINHLKMKYASVENGILKTTMSADGPNLHCKNSKSSAVFTSLIT